MRNSYDPADVQRTIEQLAARIAAAFDANQPLNIVGIRTRGEVLAQRLTSMLQQKHSFTHTGRGVLDITLYRDDLRRHAVRAVGQTREPVGGIDGRRVVLVDDVLFSGRTIRAALDALSDFGRPSMIRLAVLVDRGGRELPIQPDFVGVTLSDVPKDHRVNVRFSEIDDKDEITVEPRS